MQILGRRKTQDIEARVGCMQVLGRRKTQDIESKAGSIQILCRRIERADRQHSVANQSSALGSSEPIVSTRLRVNRPHSAATMFLEEVPGRDDAINVVSEAFGG